MVSVDRGADVVGGTASAFLSGANGCVDFAGEVAFGVTSRSFLLGMSLLTIQYMYLV